VKTEDARKVTNFLKEFGAEVHIWTVELRLQDKKVLARSKPRRGNRPT
jgi:hypothetical protein